MAIYNFEKGGAEGTWHWQVLIQLSDVNEGGRVIPLRP